MTRLRRIAVLAALGALAALSAAPPVSAQGDLAQVHVVDRDSGAVLDTYYHRGEYWVAGRPGARYALEIRNRGGTRLLAVTSVDGVNVLSGQSAAWTQGGYVLDPGERCEITGWRKSDAEVAAFTFTAASHSYAARTGRAANVGVIGVALFRESIPRPSVRIAPAPRAVDEPATQQARAPELSRDSVEEPRVATQAAAASAPLAKLGTGHGAREYSSVREVDFLRASADPDEVIRIRYDSRENLVALGIIPGARPRPVAPQAFPGSREQQFVPDPPG